MLLFSFSSEKWLQIRLNDQNSNKQSSVGSLRHEIHYNDVIMTMIASQITSLMVVYSMVYSGANQRKHQSSASLAFVWGLHREPVNSLHKLPVTRKYFHFVTSSWQFNQFRFSCAVKINNESSVHNDIAGQGRNNSISKIYRAEIIAWI